MPWVESDKFLVSVIASAKANAGKRIRKRIVIVFSTPALILTPYAWSGIVKCLGLFSINSSPKSTNQIF
jgi:hypothetical protein